MEIRVGAIFRDEFDYVIEWLAWHRIAGFEKFTVADNGSTDKTTQLLEALEEVGLVDLMHQPRTVNNSQLIAYRRICEKHLGSQEALLFIDADEFVVHESFEDGREYKDLSELLDRENVGMIGLNWRCFGSSGLEEKSTKPVLERFTKCAADREFGKNCHLKSVTNTAYAYQIGPHISYLHSPFKRYDVKGQELNEFIEFTDAGPVPSGNMPDGIARHIVSGPIRINHYVVKSKQEFVEKKLNRGDAMGGETHKKNLDYFSSHDFTDEEFSFPASKLETLSREMEFIFEQLKNSSYPRKLIGAVDKSNDKFISGWVCEQTSTGALKVAIYVNGIYAGVTKAAYYRPDLKDKRISLDGICGFYFHHQSQLLPGDKVDVKVVGNNCSLMGDRSVTIGAK